MRGLDTSNVSCRDVTSQVEFGLNLLTCAEIEVIVDPPSITVRSGEDAQFDCSARSHIEVQSIEWTRDGETLPHGMCTCELQ